MISQLPDQQVGVTRGRSEAGQSTALGLALPTRLPVGRAAPGGSPGISRRMKLLLRKGFFRPCTLGVQIGRATSPDDLEAAYRLVHDAYVAKGYIKPARCGLRIRSYEAIPETATFVARVRGAVVGVTSVVADSPDLGLPSDRAFKHELDQLRRQGRKISEGSNWVLAPEHRDSPVLTELLRCCFAHALATGCQDFVGAVSPGHVGFYELLGFEVLGPVRSYSSQIEDPVVLIRLALDRLDGRVAGVNIDEQNDEAVLTRYYVADNPYFPRALAWAQAAAERFADPAFLRELFVRRSDLLAACDDREIAAIQRRWGEDLFLAVRGSAVEGQQPNPVRPERVGAPQGQCPRLPAATGPLAAMRPYCRVDLVLKAPTPGTDTRLISRFLGLRGPDELVLQVPWTRQGRKVFVPDNWQIGIAFELQGERVQGRSTVVGHCQFAVAAGRRRIDALVLRMPHTLLRAPDDRPRQKAPLLLACAIQSVAQEVRSSRSA